LGIIDISKKGCYSIGRLPEEVCDISLENNSISRQHAVIQHRNNGNIYLYDLESTHGSFINKSKIKPRIYAQMNDGDQIRFGESMRIFILQGPPPQEESSLPKVDKIITTPIKSVKEDEDDAENKEPENVFTGNAEELKNFMKKKGAAKLKAKMPVLAKGILPDASEENEDEKKKNENDDKNDGEEEINEDLELAKRPTIGEEMYDSGDDDDEFFDRTKKKVLKHQRVN